MRDPDSANPISVDAVESPLPGPAPGVCPWCGDGRAQPVWPGAAGHGFSLQACNTCGLAYTSPQLTAEQITPYYSQAYYGAGNVRFNRLFEMLVGWFRRRRAARLQKLHPATGAVLDIGCGRGHFLCALRAAGWASTGTELNETAARHALQTLGLDIRIGPFEETPFPDASFDAIYLWHVLEHIPATRPTLFKARRMLRANGLLVIALPNLESWQARWTRYNWFHLDLPRHYVHCSTSWLTRQLTGLGFQIVEINHFSAEQNVYGWIQSVLNCSGLKPNLLYDILRRPSARDVVRPWIAYPVQSVVAMCAAFALLPFAILAMLVEAASRRGGTVEIYAQLPGTTGEPDAAAVGEPTAKAPAT